MVNVMKRPINKGFVKKTKNRNKIENIYVNSE